MGVAKWGSNLLNAPEKGLAPMECCAVLETRKGYRDGG